MSVPGFSDRVQRRQRAYWRRNWLTLHQKELCYLGYRNRDDNASRWRCCDLWLRKLANKWNSREFAIRHGAVVPELYWWGTRVDEIPFDRLPDRYVVRGIAGSSRRAVLVLDRGRNLLDGQHYDHQRIRDTMRRHGGGFPSRRLLVEEFVPPQSDTGSELPRDYKLYAFGNEVACIQVIERRPAAFVATFDDSWRPMPALRGRSNPFEVPPARPACLDEMLSMARAISVACGTFVRVDTYVGPRGAVFGELTGTPAQGNSYTDFADKYLGEYWQRTFPDAL